MKKRTLSGLLSLILGLAPLSFVQAQSTVLVRMRLQDFMKHPDLIDSLKKGVAVMKARKPSDPTSWFFQASVHQVDPDFIPWQKAELDKDPNAQQYLHSQFWNQCPHVMGDMPVESADFLLWHRAYIYYFERILRAASGNPDLTLPYWDYTDLNADASPPPMNNYLPDIFRPDPTGNPNPLDNAERDSGLESGVAALSAAAVNMGNVNRIMVFFGDSSSAEFGGDTVGATSDYRAGEIELFPHNAIHGAIGGYMAYVQTSAFDPVFWVHHSKIDQIWTMWMYKSGVTWGKYSESWFDERPWHFYDADGKEKSEPRRFFVDNQKNLAYRYDIEPLGEKQLEPPAEIQAPEAMVNAPTPRIFPGEVLAESVGNQVLQNDQRLDITLKRNPTFSTRDIIVGAHSRLSLRTPTSSKVFLELRNLTLQGIPSVLYQVFVNLPQSEPPKATSKYFVGEITSFELLGRHEEIAKRFDITSLVKAGYISVDKIQVSIVPVSLYAAEAKVTLPSKESRLAFSSAAVRAWEESR